jgi:hypothetical protein
MSDVSLHGNETTLRAKTVARRDGFAVYPSALNRPGL